MKILYKGITTNNVRNLDIVIRSGEITFIGGPSGSGKSSIAIDTIYKISEDELSQLFDTRDSVSRYEIKDYKNILPAVCLQQENYNRNPRSTIATYFGLDTYFKQLFSLKNNVSQSHFQFNTLRFACDVCKGLGVVLAPDVFAVVELSKKLRDMPFRSWRASRREYYQKSLEYFCAENSINLELQFKSLNKTDQDLLLYGKSATKYRIAFSSNGRKHTKTAKYSGPIQEIIEEIEQKKLSTYKKKYLKEVTCPTCAGKRFSRYSLTFLLYGKNIGELYCLEIDQLLDWLKVRKPSWQNSSVEIRPFRHIERFLESLVRLNLGYLTLNRSIPSLSGGELQRLRLAKSLNSQFTNFIYILDEPTSGLHPSEWNIISDVLVELKKKNNTILLIEHNEFLRDRADNCIWLGPGGGRNGGQIVTEEKKCFTKKTLPYRFIQSTSEFEIGSASSNNINDLDCNIPLGTVVGVCGVSGSGKTSFMKNILPRYLDNTQYFSQTAIRGNAYSIVGTALGIFEEIISLFAAETGGSRENFFYSSQGKGQCEVCSGKGFLEEISSYVPEPLLCPACGGRRFSEFALKKRWNGLDIYEFLSLHINDILLMVPKKNILILKALNLASNVGLGYLTLFQSTSTLSGGEAQRVKFSAKLLEKKRKRIILMDEPFRGLDKQNIQGIIRVLYAAVEDGSSVFISEHNPFALSYCSYLIELGPGSGIYGGNVTYLGEKSNFVSKGSSIMEKLIAQETGY
ncbi:ATP-binding cassette domain-containing protein [Thiorhodovibrio frisius]|uniref:UvrABC system protein A n=1 Tax=Thiorhodovibrio frisius TaxID=631362 RepID=H8YW27_9GAMM|nr:ATP-binding cassette domain-containing protein [Thiorhodovibrio frisius]EIC23818.1 Excinuclease ATPase subunit [Thiorhodovibrio frisius]WPL22997.1 Excinuclease ABC subunit A [Thiorhodovibrio frisius]